MATVELDYEELAEHESHDLTVRIDDSITLYCNTCSKVIAEAELPTYRATVRLTGYAWVTRAAANEDAMREMVESMYFPGDEDDLEIEVDDIEIEED